MNHATGKFLLTIAAILFLSNSGMCSDSIAAKPSREFEKKFKKYQGKAAIVWTGVDTGTDTSARFLKLSGLFINGTDSDIDVPANDKSEIRFRIFENGILRRNPPSEQTDVYGGLPVEEDGWCLTPGILDRFKFTIMRAKSVRPFFIWVSKGNVYSVALETAEISIQSDNFFAVWR